MERSLACFVFLLALAHQGLCLIAVTDPERDMIVAGSEGDCGIVFECSIYNDLTLQNRRITQWSLTEDPNAMPLVAVPLNLLFPNFDTTFNITGDPTNIPSISPPSFNNVLIILNFTTELDGQTLICGTGGAAGEPFIAGFPLRLYRPPVLTTDGTFTIIESLSDTFSVKDSTAPPAFPTPTIFWFRNGESVANVSTVGFTYPQVSFAPVNRGDSGTYTLRAFNTRLNSSEVVGNATGSFELDVLFGPEADDMFQPRHVVLEGSDLDVSCATNLQSNPAATVVWMDNNGVEIMNTPQYALNNVGGSVSLNITPTQGRDNGQWSCTLNVTGPPETIGGAEVGVVTRTFTIVVVVPPNPPELVTVIEDNSTTTSLFVCWQGSPPTDFTPVSQYEVTITADDDNTVINERTTSNETSLLVDDLLPGTAYSIQVVAIATVDDVEGRSNFSNTHQTNTSTTVPAPVCVSVVSDRGNITVTWAFTHTGGLILTELTVNYSFMEGEVTNTVPVTVSLEQTSATVGGLEVARRYTFTIIGSNEMGPGQVVCPEFLHSIGIPQAPKTPLISQSGARDVRLNLTTVAAGVGPSPHSFRFNVRVTNINNVQMDNFETFRVDDYANGEYRDFLITDLTVGQAYTFSAQSANDFGSSPFIPAERVITISADCGVPQASASGSIAPYSSTLEGAVISFQCDQGFSPSEEVTATCVRDENSTTGGTWTPDPAEHSCRNDIVDCGIPQPPASGSITSQSSTLEGAVISFQCGQGFSPSEEVTATCVRDEDTGSGTWTPDPAEHSCRSSIGGSKFELSIGSAVAIATVLSSVVFFILGVVSGILIHYCITAKRAQYSVSSISTEPIATTPAPVYEEVTATDTHPKAIELSENIAYGPARQ